MNHEERLTEAVARAINRAAFKLHGNEDKEEDFWNDVKLARMEQARAAIAAYRSYDERK